jgi:Flp pilus assembly protein TadG
MILRDLPNGRGQALVEFALVIPIFLLMLFGILDLGRAVYAYSTLNNAAREGARVAVVDQTVSHIQGIAAGHATGLGIAPADVTIDWRTADAPDTPNSCAGNLASQLGDSITCTAIVRVAYLYSAATPLIGNIVGQINMAGESRMIIEFACQEPSTPVCPVGP